MPSPSVAVQQEEIPPPTVASSACRGALSEQLPPAVRAALWRGDQLGPAVAPVVPTGFAALDRELPGGGWPCRSLIEVLQPQPTVAEWRLLGAAMRRVVARGRIVVVVGPPKSPHLPGLRHLGLDARHLLWVRAEALSERLWTTEQLIRSDAAGLVVAWLPQARPEQIRRLQLCAQGCDDALVFLCRPAAAGHEPSAAPLRVELRVAADWELHLRLVKRRGPIHDGLLRLPSVPGGLESIITPRLRWPSALAGACPAFPTSHPAETPHAVGSATCRDDPVPAESGTAH